MSYLTYIKCRDYFIPDIALSEVKTKPLGKYGRLRITYLKEHRHALNNYLVLSEELFPYLNEADKQAQHLLDTMLPQMEKQQGITEELKATNQLEWVGRVNNIVAQIEEIIFTNIVCV